MDLFAAQSSLQAFGFGLFMVSLFAIPPIVILRGIRIGGWGVFALLLYVLGASWATMPALRPSYGWLLSHWFFWLLFTCFGAVLTVWSQRRAQQ